VKVLFVFKSDFLIIPLGIRTLSAVLKQEGHCCEFIDLKLEFGYLKKIREFKPDIIAYSIESFLWRFYQDFNKKLKKHLDFFAIFGGPHCTLNPGVINEEGVDAICIGEGEQALAELASNLENNRDIRGIKNLWIKLNGIIYKNDIRSLVPNLDSIPFPDFDFASKYQAYKSLDIYHIITSRGCAYNCPYCINHFYRNLYSGKGKYVRRRSVDNVIEELKIVKNKLKPKLIYFVDEIFTLDKTWLDEFAPKYLQQINLPFQAFTRTNEIDKDTVELLHKIGYVTACVGIESGNEKIRFEILKRKIDDRQIVEATALLLKNNIKILGSNMLGLPGETLSNAFETLKLNARCKITYPMVFMFHPFPNIELTNYSIENNYYDGKADSFDKLAGKSLINSKEKKQIERLYHLFYMGVKMPFTIPLIRLMTKLPLDLFYRFIFYFSRAVIILFIMRRPSLKSLIVYYLRSPFVLLQNKLVKL